MQTEIEYQWQKRKEKKDCINNYRSLGCNPKASEHHLKLKAKTKAIICHFVVFNVKILRRNLSEIR